MSIIQPSEQDFRLILESNDKVIIKYYADWCGSCKLFSPKYTRLSNDERFTDITFLEVNAETNPEARALAGVDNLPFFATFKNGALVEGTATTKEENVVGLLDRLNA
ncbi:MAG: thioredoxin family protein [Candidatus Kapabacteria bacterium]|nr:thioredoxin family protein [Candidatus Kapabacteria bacterium]